MICWYCTWMFSVEVLIPRRSLLYRSSFISSELYLLAIIARYSALISKSMFCEEAIRLSVSCDECLNVSLF